MCCREKCACDHPQQEPQACTPEQIRECHGEAAEHPCESKTEETEST